MNRFRSGLCVLGLAVVVFVLGGCGAPVATSEPTSAPATVTPTEPPTPTATPLPVPTNTPAPQTFISSRYGYSVSYPGGWVANEIAGEWTPDVALGSYVPGTDLLAAVGASIDTVSISAQSVPSSTTLDTWTATNEDLHERIHTMCGPKETEEQTTLGGEAAILQTYHCSDGFFAIFVWAMHDAKGYGVIWLSKPGNEDEDRAAFDQILSSFAFMQK